VDAGDTRLVAVPSIPGRQCFLHWAAAAAFNSLAAAWLRDNPNAAALLAQSGWRRRKPWQASRKLYNAELIRRYASRLPGASRDEVIAYGRKRLAYRSAHQTGLAFDLGSPPPMKPDSRRGPTGRMKASAVYAWMLGHGPPCGVRNYLIEPWHFEMPVSADIFRAPGPEAPDPSADFS